MKATQERPKLTQELLNDPQFQSWVLEQPAIQAKTRREENKPKTEVGKPVTADK